ncbi:pyrroline-5-carboxylate reductase [Candidatus Nomurabacteria bacterium RIFCSPLOWO2_01_FULL_41_21]|uniref:Pyrroline-5-carboxylate reductase n=2 Tax=Candidatus Nomuraibacteriota TaxID=1752729 RepID=A0A1F6V3E6_9BACT|nr:MAG: pyrroline-5-carboxylate reductase [Candidatus Nomurabacteria bacterium RIFCSPHIGHO2_01_FULL_40_20]OGI88807.1 MAG: pyrroline-5-carboxylate reductase [Candidatus Nomurabacteria bacterium RIFCSPLOWO2_01_FULL_41_21]
MEKRISILGAGNIGLAIADGISKAKIAKGRIAITRKSEDFSDELRKVYDCVDNEQALRFGDILILAVQPKQVEELLSEMKGSIKEHHLLISVVSGVSITRIKELLGNDKVKVVRAMPNTSIRYGESMTCLAFNESAMEHRDLVERIFNSLGKFIILEESKFPQATVLCGSGPALMLKFARAYMQAGIQNGFNEHDALLIAGQLMRGVSRAILEGKVHPEVEIDKVTTPGGCTIDALIEMDHAGFSSALLRAVSAGVDKAKSLYS